jgi:hypothetical protein
MEHETHPVSGSDESPYLHSLAAPVARFSRAWPRHPLGRRTDPNRPARASGRAAEQSGEGTCCESRVNCRKRFPERTWQSRRASSAKSQSHGLAARGRFDRRGKSSRARSRLRRAAGGRSRCGSPAKGRNWRLGGWECRRRRGLCRRGPVELGQLRRRETNAADRSRGVLRRQDVAPRRGSAAGCGGKWRQFPATARR